MKMILKNNLNIKMNLKWPKIVLTHLLKNFQSKEVLKTFTNKIMKEDSPMS